ncbi:type IV toxin-antitoxin system AbiEi family antitoxin domain-containing protein [Nocardioides antri]|uniref:type IV toxin-antitoxin system AbiEi family antitoxin domain-containing protein n=1 Tax=Nocardioides antri TaxID=2607659 RepID=UPI00165F8011|nr:type IV toxin-antitoxin system AbiEi family antitoxin domain-containing protein [Nocardioides antri]
MDPLRFLTSEHGFFTRQEAREAGYDDRAVARMVRSRTWVRFRRGYYAFADEWEGLDEVGRHRVRSSAVLRSLGDVVALSHVSGSVRHDIEVWGAPLDRVHVTRLDGGPGRIEGDVVHHEGLTVDNDVMVVAGERVLPPARCALEAGSRLSNEPALCLFDAGLRNRKFDHEELAAQFRLMQHWPFMRHLHIPVRMADGRSGSVGESRGRWTFRIVGLPAPVLQYEVRDRHGILIGIVDWWWPQLNLMGEFDGRIKYGRLLKPGQNPGDAVFEEKKREDELREVTGAAMLRLTWADYERPIEIRRRVERLARLAG